MNSIEIEGFTSYSKVHNFQGGAFSHRFSVTLQAGKDKTGAYRKEYIDVRLSSDCSQALQYPGDGTRIKVKGRLRCEPWIDRNQQKRKAIYVEAFEAQVIQPPNPAYQQQAAPQGQPQGNPYMGHQPQQPMQQAHPAQAPSPQMQPPMQQAPMPNQYQQQRPVPQAPVAPQPPMPPQGQPQQTFQPSNDLDGIPF